MLELIGRYRIHEQIGEGAMADVYRAHDPHIDRALAIKVLKPEYRQDREYSARFLREARAAGALSHPGIVTVFDVGQVDDYPFIVMELLDGEPLSEVLKRGGMPPSKVISIGIQLADALGYAHAQGVIHRDIKPSNIILSPDGNTLKLLDFGIAQLEDHDPLFEEQSYRTQIGQVIGTPRYMSPEQALGREMDGRSDIYSVGVVLYEMLSGQRAFTGSGAAALTAQILTADPKPLNEVAPDTPRGLQFIVQKAMAKQPTQRFADALRLAAALRREYSVAESVAVEAAAQRRYLPLQVRLTLLMALITAIVLAGAVGTVLVKQRDAMRQVAVTSGRAVTAFVANNAALRAVDNAALPPEQQDWVPVQAFVKSASADPNLRGLTVVDSQGIIRAATNQDMIGQRYRPAQGEPLITTREGVRVSDVATNQSFRFVRPITYAGHDFGKVDLMLNQADLRSAAQLSTWLLIALAVITLATVALVTFLSARVLQAPITRLRDALLELARGNLDFRVSHKRRDEFGELFDDVNLVAQTMQERLNAVEAMLLDRPVAPALTPDSPAPPAPEKAFEEELPLPASKARLAEPMPAVSAIPIEPAIEPVRDETPAEAPAPDVPPPFEAPELPPLPPAEELHEDEEEDEEDEIVDRVAPQSAAPREITAAELAPPFVPSAPEPVATPAPEPAPEPILAAAPEPVAAPEPEEDDAEAEEDALEADDEEDVAPEEDDEDEDEPEEDPFAIAEPMVKPIAAVPHPAPEPEEEPARQLSPPWPHDEDEDRTLVDPEDSQHR
ncbi:protein kinase domain-containing protein [Sphingomonas sp. ASY06-1R]|uniref:protein kinase domain-containing protein n=1 Tax=Sphingomonas sp. ASY06-1R TaxID=3445771 RepID=UPI003FA2DFA3